MSSNRRYWTPDGPPANYRTYRVEIAGEAVDVQVGYGRTDEAIREARETIGDPSGEVVDVRLIAAERHYCCSECGTVISNRAWPDECEHCHAGLEQLLQYRGLADAELRAQLVTGGNHYASDDDAGTPTHNLRV